MADNTILNNVSNTYQTPEFQKAAEADPLGQEAFLTMLIAQLQNQDPLNPMDGTDFSSQLAQFSQLEQLMNINKSLENQGGQGGIVGGNDPMTYIGKSVVGTVDTLQVKKGNASAGVFRLENHGDVRVAVVDENGQTVRTIDLGNKSAGNHSFQWDGEDASGRAVEDGAYTYQVLVNEGDGFRDIPTTVSGAVEGIMYEDGKPYLVVQGVLMDLEDITAVTETPEDPGPINPENIFEYLGKTVETNNPIVMVEDGAVSGGELGFTLTEKEAVSVNIYDSANNLIRTIEVDAEDMEAGAQSVEWDGKDANGDLVEDGLYLYSVESASGEASVTSSGEVTGIKSVNGVQLLVLGETGRLVSHALITEITK